MGGTTWDKLDRLRSLGLFSSKKLDLIEDSFSCLIRMRLGRQLAAISNGQEPDNCINPDILSDRVRSDLRSAFKGVDTLLQLLRNHYKLDMIAR